MRGKRGFIGLAVCLSWNPAAGAAPDATEAVAVPRWREPPAIDGRLDEADWTTAALLGGFVQTYPEAGAVATRTTEVRLAYDATALYLGIRAVDDPGQVRAALHRRDELADDDVIAVYLDTFGDGTRAYALRFNALGVQQDGVFLEGSGTDLSIDLSMTSVGRLTDGGFELEVAVPFASLRFPARPEHRWGLQVLRQIRHLGEESSWRPLPVEQAVRFPQERKSLLGGAGRLWIADGLAAGRRLEVVPTVSTSVVGERAASGSGDADDFRQGDPESRAGLTARGGWGRNLLLELAWRPDFGEVEADAPVLTANNPFPVFFAERRPFFLEGLELFRTLATTVDTRRIEAPESAFKTTWQGERDALALLAARDGEDGAAADDLLLRYRRSLGGEAWLGGLVTARETADRSNTVASVDGRFRLGPKTTLAAQLSGSVTEGLFYDPDQDREVDRRGTGAGLALDLDHQRERLSFRLSALGFSPDYRADLGYLAQADSHRCLAEVRYSPPARPEAKLVSWAFLSTVLLQTNSAGRSEYGYFYPRVELSFRRQTYLNLAVYYDYRRVFEEDYGPRRSAERAGAFAGDSERSTYYHGGTVTLGTSAGKTWSAELAVDLTWNTLDYDLGAGPKYPRVSPAALADPAAPLDPGSGDSRTATLSLSWQPSERWLATLSLSRDRLVRDDTGRTAYASTLASLRLQRHFSRATLVRLRLDHDSIASRTSGQLLFAFQPSLGTSIYLGYDDTRTYDGFDPATGAPERGWHPSRRAAFLKLSYAWGRGW